MHSCSKRRMSPFVDVIFQSQHYDSDNTLPDNSTAQPCMLGLHNNSLQSWQTCQYLENQAGGGSSGASGSREMISPFFGALLLNFDTFST